MLDETNENGDETPGAEETKANQAPAGGPEMTPAEQVASKEVPAASAGEPAGATNPGEQIPVDASSTNAEGLHVYQQMAEASGPLKTAFGVLQERQVSADDMEAIFGQAQRTGDPKAINTKVLADKVGQATADLIMGNIDQHLTEVKANAEASNKLVYDTVGGEENWGEIVNWAKANLDDAIRQEYVDMINSGGKQAELAAQSLMTQASGDSSTTLTQGLLESGTAAATGAKGLSKADYAQAYQDAHRAGRPSQAELTRLDDLRRLGVRQGI